MISRLSGHRVLQLASDPSMNPIKIQGDHVPSLPKILEQLSLVYGLLSPFMNVGTRFSRPLLFLCLSQTLHPALALWHPAAHLQCCKHSRALSGSTSVINVCSPLSSTPKSPHLGLIHLGPPRSPSIVREDSVLSGGCFWLLSS